MELLKTSSSNLFIRNRLFNTFNLFWHDPHSGRRLHEGRTKSRDNHLISWVSEHLSPANCEACSGPKIQNDLKLASTIALIRKKNSSPVVIRVNVETLVRLWRWCRVAHKDKMGHYLFQPPIPGRILCSTTKLIQIKLERKWRRGFSQRNVVLSWPIVILCEVHCVCDSRSATGFLQVYSVPRVCKGCTLRLDAELPSFSRLGTCRWKSSTTTIHPFCKHSALTTIPGRSHFRGPACFI